MNRNEINSAATAEDITRAFFTRFSSEGLDKVSIGDVCSDCHISRTTFYRYFTDKFDVLEKKEQYLLNGTENFSDSSLMFFAVDRGSKSVNPEFLHMLEFVKENMFYYKAILSSNFSRRFMVKWSAQINDGIRGKMENADSGSNEFLLRTVSAGFLAGLSNWIEKEPGLSVAEVADIFSSIFSGTAAI